MSKSRVYALAAGKYGMIAIAAITRHDIIPGVLVFLVAIGSAFRANKEGKRENP